MEPFASTSFDGPQYDDILAVHRSYGDVFESGSGMNEGECDRSRPDRKHDLRGRW
ncbi:MAG: hypothetical protein CM1200mP2_55340 [Planctomycetaceae bacterium]|nr:MAG: hypothetical protein CM1200mP2_55340 [Planctomycetaceae bacterium]